MKKFVAARVRDPLVEGEIGGARNGAGGGRGGVAQFWLPATMEIKASAEIEAVPDRVPWRLGPIPPPDAGPIAGGATRTNKQKTWGPKDHDFLSTFLDLH